MKAFPVRLFINGVQVGDNATFTERAESVEAAASESAAFYRAEGYTVETEITTARRWEVTEPEPTVIVRCSK